MSGQFHSGLTALALGTFLACLPAGSGQAISEGPPGRFSRPIISTGGEVRVVAQGSSGEWRLETWLPRGTAPVSSIPLSLSPDLAGVEAFEGPEGGLWLAEEVRGQSGSTLVLGTLAGQAFEEKWAFGPAIGRNDGPDILFRSSGEPWAAWRHEIGDFQEILVRDLAAGLTWRLSPSGSAGLSAPKLLSDSQGRVAAVWSGRDREGYGVFIRRRSGRSWTSVRRITSTGRFPCLQPDAVVDGIGRLIVVWTAYDGEKYDIFYSAESNVDWEHARRISADGTSKGSPGLAVLSGTTIAVSWIESERRTHLLKTAVLGPDPAPVTIIAEGLAVPLFRLGSRDGRLALAWDAPAGPAVRSIDQSALWQGIPAAETAPAPPVSNAAPAAGILFNPALSEKGYIAFGDSITFGELDGLSVPEKGYVPRLEAKLDVAFGPTDISNDGVPGEYTSGGLFRINSVLAVRQSRYILLMEGTNDVKLLTIPPETTEFNIREMVRRCLAAGSLPILATVIPRRDWIWYFPEYVDRQNRLLAAIRRIAAEFVIPLADMNKAFEDYPGGPELLLQSDGKHPNEKGYQFLADTWYAAVRKLPFPAEDIQSERDYDRILFYRQAGNVLSWRSNPKTADATLVQGYKIYRRRVGESPDKFRLITLAKDVFSYFDTALEGADIIYEYVIATLRTDTVEGPCSAVARTR